MAIVQLLGSGCLGANRLEQARKAAIARPPWVKLLGREVSLILGAPAVPETRPSRRGDIDSVSDKARPEAALVLETICRQS